MPNVKSTLLHPLTALLCASLLCSVANAQGSTLPAVAPAGQASIARLESAPAMLSATSSSSSSWGSSSSSTSLPDAPQVSTPDQRASASQPANSRDVQTKRILGIIPNFRAVSADVKLPPQSVKDKFVTVTRDSFDYSSFILPGVLAGYSQARNSTPEFRQGAVGYGRYYWHNLVDQTVENYFVEFIVPAATHEDTRYYTLGRGGFLKRSRYAITRVVITRNDAGKETFNAGEIAGSAIASGISAFYYPASQRTFGNVGGKWGQNVGVDAATFVFKEFWPDINHHLFHPHMAGQ